MHSRTAAKIQNDVPTASLLVSKAHGLNLVVFTKHRLKAILRALRELRGEKISVYSCEFVVNSSCFRAFVANFPIFPI